MPTSLTFRDHSEFHRAAADMAIAGGLVGLAAHVVGLAWSPFGPIDGPWGLAALVGAAAIGATPPSARAEVRAWLSLIALSLVAGLGLSLIGPGAGAGAALAFALPTALLLARGLRDHRFAIGVLVAAPAALAARFVLARLVHAPQLAALPPWLVVAAAGAAFAFVLVLARLPRHIDLARDRVADACTRVRPALAGEVAELAERAMDVWRRVATTLEAESPVRRSIEDSVLRLLDVAGRWQAVEADGGRTPVEALVERMQQLDAKIEKSSDDVAKAQYTEARAALAEQIHDLREIATSRERVIARMHHYLAAMERLRLAVIRHRSADASRLSTEVQPILDDLRQLGQEIDLTSEAMGEVEREAAAGPTPAPGAAATPSN
jgi:hypothetical protein